MQFQNVGTSRRFPTAKDIEKAAQAHNYIRVSGTPNNAIRIVGARKTFMTPATANYVYVPELRLVGTPEDLMQAIMSLGVYTPEEAQAFIDNGYNAGNYNVPEAEGGQAERFNEEVATSSAARGALKKEREAAKPPPVNLNNLDYLYQVIIGPTKEGTRSRTAGTTSRRKTTLADRLAALAPGQVLDVTNFNPLTGTGAKTITAPAGKSTKIGVPGVNIVSSNPQTYAAAIQQIYSPQDAQRIIRDYNAMLAIPVASGTRRVSPPAQAAARAAYQRVTRPNVQPMRQEVRTSPVQEQPVQEEQRQASPRQEVPRQASPRQASPRQQMQAAPRVPGAFPTRPAIPQVGGLPNLSRLGPPPAVPAARPAFGSPEEQ